MIKLWITTSQIGEHLRRNSIIMTFLKSPNHFYPTFFLIIAHHYSATPRWNKRRAVLFMSFFPSLDPNPNIPPQQKDNQYGWVFSSACWALWWFGQTASGKLETGGFLEGVERGRKKERSTGHDRASLSLWTQAVRWHFPSRWKAEERFVIPLIGYDYIITRREWSGSVAGANWAACSATNDLLVN